MLTDVKVIAKRIIAKPGESFKAAFFALIDGIGYITDWYRI
jgi:hypothetical protein